jgi:hypothetical protein
LYKIPRGTKPKTKKLFKEPRGTKPKTKELLKEQCVPESKTKVLPPGTTVAGKKHFERRNKCSRTGKKFFLFPESRNGCLPGNNKGACPLQGGGG